MLRGFDYGFLAALGMALVHGVAWSVVELTFGLLVVGVFGGWLIGYAVRHGAAAHRAREMPDAADNSPPAADREAAASAHPPAPRGLSTMAALLGAMAWFVGSYVAFAIVQLTTGQGDLLARLAPANFAPFMAALLEPPLLQMTVLGAYMVVGALSARPSAPRPAAPGR